MTAVNSRRPTGAISITAAMLLGFGLTLVVWLVAGYGLTVRIQDTRRRAEAATARYLSAQDLLSTVNAEILLGSVYLRDALLEAGPPDGDAHQAVEATYDTVRRMLEAYVPVSDSATERDRVDRLRLEIDDFRRAMLEVLNTASVVSARRATILLRTQVVPKRAVVIRVSEEVRALNREAFIRQQAEVTEIYATSQRWFWVTLSLAIVASFGIALAALRYAGRLEGQLQRQLVVDAQNARELQHLSAKLITAQEEERRTIARELHDEVGQGLTAIKVELAVAQHAIQASGVDARVLNDARAITDGALATIRDLSHLLHPAILDDLGLVAAIDAYVSSFGHRHRIQMDLVQSGLTDRLSPDVETTIYRIIQEALTNVAKHARAARCRISLRRAGDRVTVTIEDQGVGFDASAPGRAGLGLVGIRERAHRLRGSLTIESAPGEGTRLTVDLPAPARQPDADEPPMPGTAPGETTADTHDN